MAAKTKVQRDNPRSTTKEHQPTKRRRQAQEQTAGSADIDAQAGVAPALPETAKEIMLAASDPEGRQLFALAIQIQKLKPWRWMEETDLIGIENPETGEIGFISVMGAVGEYEAVALYLGPEGFHGFIDLQQESNPDRLIELTHVQVAFSDRNDLEKEDLNLIKALGLKFRGAGAWPMFRSYRTGYLPWFITRDEARFLIQALAQIIEVARRVRSETQPFHPTGRVEEGGYLMRVARKTEAGLVWEDQVWRIPKPATEPMYATVDAAIVESLKRIARSQAELEVDLTLAPVRIGEPGQRPLAAYLLMMADRDSGFIFGSELMTAEDSLRAMYSCIPQTIANQLLRERFVPGSIAMRSDKLRTLLKPLAQKLNIPLRYADELPSIDEAMEAMVQWMQSGRFS